MVPFDIPCPKCETVRRVSDARQVGVLAECANCAEMFVLDVEGCSSPVTTVDLMEMAQVEAATCPSCDNCLPEGAVLCTECGFDLRTGKKIRGVSCSPRITSDRSERSNSDDKENACPSCGAHILPNESRCPKCRTRIRSRGDFGELAPESEQIAEVLRTQRSRSHSFWDRSLAKLEKIFEINPFGLRSYDYRVQLRRGYRMDVWSIRELLLSGELPASARARRIMDRKNARPREATIYDGAGRYEFQIKVLFRPIRAFTSKGIQIASVITAIFLLSIPVIAFPLATIVPSIEATLPQLPGLEKLDATTGFVIMPLVMIALMAVCFVLLLITNYTVGLLGAILWPFCLNFNAFTLFVSAVTLFAPQLLLIAASLLAAVIAVTYLSFIWICKIPGYLIGAPLGFCTGVTRLSELPRVSPPVR